MNPFRVGIGLTASLIALSLPVSAAQAHTELVASSPAVDSQVDSWPSEVRLTFSEDLQSIGESNIMKVTVHNAIAEEVGGVPTVKGATISVPLAKNSMQGLTLVSYRVASADGHVVEGEYTFTFGKSTPGVSTILPIKKKNNTAIYGASTILIVLTMLFGLWAYRKRRD
jgi:methionine-rich copper-binding protein CopC